MTDAAPPPKRIVGSYSFFNELENCPLKAYEVRIAKSIQYIESPESRWGNYVHDSMEHRVGVGTPLPEEIAEFEPYAQPYDMMRRVGAEVLTEQKLGITADGRSTKFWGDGCYVGGKVDVTVRYGNHVDITDWKTGKEDYETPFELELHALLIAAKLAPQPLTFTARYAYIGRAKRPDKIGKTYDVSNVGATWAKVNSLMHRAYQYQRNDHWPAQKNPLCGWCQVTKCPHNAPAVAARKKKEMQK